MTGGTPATTEGQDIATSIKKSLRFLTVATIALYLFMGAVVGFLYHDSVDKRSSIAAVARDTAGALCTLRTDLQVQVDSSEKFLKTHPKGIPGIPAAVIKSGIESRKRTVKALATLKCPSRELPQA